MTLAARLAGAGLALLALFAPLVSAGAALGLRLAAAPAALDRLELPAGLLVGGALLAGLLLRRPA